MHRISTTIQRHWLLATICVGMLAAISTMSGCLAVAAGAGAGVGYAVGSQQDDEVDADD